MYAYKFDENKYYAGKQECQLDPLETELAGHDAPCHSAGT